MTRFIILATALAMLAGCLSTARAEAPEIAYGRRIAQANCGGCHAVGAGASPLADAPPFRDLQKRYGPGGLSGLLSEGMLAPDPPPEEGSISLHPRMPSVKLDVEQRNALIAFLHSLESASGDRPGPIPVPAAFRPASGGR